MYKHKNIPVCISIELRNEYGGLVPSEISPSISISISNPVPQPGPGIDPFTSLDEGGFLIKTISIPTGIITPFTVLYEPLPVTELSNGMKRTALYHEYYG